jgi:DtxR family Mn-dependent transcriptional regulator
MLSFTEENYLKAILKFTMESGKTNAGTNELASHLDVKPATVTDMLKKLRDKKLVDYEKYGKVSLTKSGKKHATDVLRKHRLWETFLYEKLEFTWDEVHEVAEQLEHIQSGKLIEKLDKFLGHPAFDPHGDPIPNSKGEFSVEYKKVLADVAVGKSCKMVAVKDSTTPFLQYVMKVGLGLSSKIKVLALQEYDHSITIEVNGTEHTVSQKFAENIYVI